MNLFLNGKSLGVRKLSETKDAMLQWKVPYEPGELKAVAYQNGEVAAENNLKTAGEPNKIILKSDRPLIKADGQDIASIKILVTDKAGNIVPYADNEVEIKINGRGVNAGIGNGDSNDIEDYKSDHHKVYEGKARLYIQSNGEKGEIKIQAASKGLKNGEMIVNAF